MKDLLHSSLEAFSNHCESDLSSILKKKNDQLADYRLEVDLSTSWKAESFELDKVKLFRKLKDFNKKKILENIGLSKLKEAYVIENAGMTFASKMVLLSENIEEKRMYSHFCAEEAEHFSFFEGILSPYELSYSTDPFLNLLHRVIIEGKRNPLIFIVQVVLEGWGIDHYSFLASTCHNKKLKNILNIIVADEASHHGSGLVLFDEKNLSQEEFDFICDTMAEFLQLVAIGPIGIVYDIEKSLGTLSSNDRMSIYTEMGAFASTKGKLDLIRKLIERSGAKRILARLESFNCFDPILESSGLFSNPLHKHSASLIL